MSVVPMYVPVLRSRAAERDAVLKLSRLVRRNIAPLHEICSSTARDWSGLEARAAARAALNVLSGLDGSSQSYLDLGDLLDRSDADKLCMELEAYLLRLPLKVMLAFSLRDYDRKGGLSAARLLLERQGAAFRVTHQDYANAALSDFRFLLRRLNLQPSEVDLIVDCKIVVEHQPMRGTAAKLEGEFPWRSIIYLGGSFPPNLSDLAKNDQHDLPRHEWVTFSGESKRDTSRIRFGDYTVQHPFQPDPPPQNLPSGSIRYASELYWVVMRGEKLDNPKGPGSAQYIAQAQLLRDRPEYRGPDFSYGDAYIDFIASQTKKTGSPKKWLEAAINHHVTLTAHQIAQHVAA